MDINAPRSLAQGDTPETVRRRYLTEGRGAQLAYFTDQTAKQPAFQDAGRRLTTGRTDPNVIRDMLEIAEHRGWTRVEVRGSIEFRREAWLQALGRGLEADGFRPGERDRQAAERRATRESREPPARSRDRRPDHDRGVTGELIEVGSAAYKYRRGAERSPFIKVRLESGRVQTVWGVGLPAALKEVGAEVGDHITARRTGVEQVWKTVRHIDHDTGDVYREQKEVPRNQWEITAGRFRDATPAQASRDPGLRGAQRSMATVEAVVRSRAEPAAAERMIAAARERVAGWLERGARFEPRRERQAPIVDRGRERRR